VRIARPIKPSYETSFEFHHRPPPPDDEALKMPIVSQSKESAKIYRSLQLERTKQPRITKSATFG
jgi:hypothetical protein